MQLLNADPLYPTQWEPYWAQGEEAIRGHLPINVLAQLYEAVKERLAYIETVRGHEDPDGPYADAPIHVNEINPLGYHGLYMCRAPIRVDLLPDVADMQGSLWNTPRTFDDRFIGFTYYSTYQDPPSTPFFGTLPQYIATRVRQLCMLYLYQLGFFDVANYNDVRLNINTNSEDESSVSIPREIADYPIITNKVQAVASVTYEDYQYSDSCYDLCGHTGPYRAMDGSIILWDPNNPNMDPNEGLPVYPAYNNGTKSTSRLLGLYHTLNELATRYTMVYNRARAAQFRDNPSLELTGNTLDSVSCIYYQAIPQGTFRFHA